MKLFVDLGTQSYEILIQRGMLGALGQFVDLHRKVLVVTDSGVPEAYVKTVLSQCPNGAAFAFPQGEQSKTMDVLQEILAQLLQHSFTREDLVIALGGGVTGDMAGLAASLYMRGIDFVNLPTTTLAQVDSSIGGKTAVDFGGVKNIVGTFYQPKFVGIDPDVLKTLPQRHFYSGLVEAVKAGLLADETLFCQMEENIPDYLEEILYRSLCVKREIVMEDEKEQGKRKLLNLGHTLGHAIEAAAGLGGLLHGECVAIGMLPMITDVHLRQRVEQLFGKMGIPLKAEFDRNKAAQALLHDKKMQQKGVTMITIPAIGHPEMQVVDPEFVKEKLA